MSRMASGFAVLIVATCLSLLHADSYEPFRDFRQVDATGRFYIVVKKYGDPEDPGDGTRVKFVIAERKPGSPPVLPAEEKERGGASATNSDVNVREGDLVLGQGRLKRSPRHILISSTGLGFVGLDVRGSNYGDLRSGDAVVIVSRDGTVRHRKDLIDLFSEQEIGQYFRSAGSIWWCGGGWIDEAHKEVVVLGSQDWMGERPVPRRFRIVNIETGAVRRGSSDVVLTALAEGIPGALDEALELVSELKLTQAKADVSKIFSDNKLGIETRLRACVALAALGDRGGAEFVKNAAFGEPAGRKYAIGALPAVLGDDAPGVLCEVVRQGMNGSGMAWQAMHHVSAEAAIPPVLNLLRAQHCSECINFAVECLAIDDWKPKAAVSELIKLLEQKPKTVDPLWTQRLVAKALGRIGPEASAALPALIRLAELHTADEWAQVKSRQPEQQRNVFGQMEYSEDAFVNAICTLRAK